MEIHSVTGAAGYSGRAIAALLLERGVAVRSLTAHPGRPHPFGQLLEVVPLVWEDPTALARAFEGVRVLYNTWWIRFAHGGVDHALAVARSRQIIAAAARAGVERVVHTSITRPSLDSALPYFAGKAQVEEALNY